MRKNDKAHVRGNIGVGNAARRCRREANRPLPLFARNAGAVWTKPQPTGTLAKIRS